MPSVSSPAALDWSYFAAVAAVAAAAYERAKTLKSCIPPRRPPSRHKHARNTMADNFPSRAIAFRVVPFFHCFTHTRTSTLTHEHRAVFHRSVNENNYFPDVYIIVQIVFVAYICISSCYYFVYNYNNTHGPAPFTTKHAAWNWIVGCFFSQLFVFWTSYKYNMRVYNTHLYQYIAHKSYKLASNRLCHP